MNLFQEPVYATKKEVAAKVFPSNDSSNRFVSSPVRPRVCVIIMNKMDYPEFNAYTPYVDPKNKLFHAYTDSESNLFYVEPGFYDGLLGFKERRLDEFHLIMEELDRIVKANHRVIFTADFENPWIEREGFIYREIHDLTDPLRIFVEDKSRGSDYGD